MVFRWFKRLFQSEPTNEEVLDALEECYQEMDNQRSEFEIFRAEILDRIEGVLIPISRRLSTREYRQSKKEDLNSEETFKKGGLITPQQAKHYGITKQTQKYNRETEG